MRKKLILTLALITLMSLSMSGCFASCENRKSLTGGYIGSYKADYIVINYSGSQIMDVWILKDHYVTSESSSDGVSFVDNNGNGIIVQGDAKILRINTKADMDKYFEYHYETDLISYQDFYKSKKK